jgi:photosystem I subunit 4
MPNPFCPCTIFPFEQSGIRYPVVVRFDTQNYAGVTTNNYGLAEVEEAK